MNDLERIRIIARLKAMGFKRLGNTPRTKYLIIAYKEGVEKALEELEMDYTFGIIRRSTYSRIRKMLMESRELFEGNKKDNEDWSIEDLFE